MAKGFEMTLAASRVPTATAVSARSLAGNEIPRRAKALAILTLVMVSAVEDARRRVTIGLATQLRMLFSVGSFRPVRALNRSRG